MKKILLVLAILCINTAFAQVETVKPSAVIPFPDVTLDQYWALDSLNELGKLTAAQKQVHDNCVILEELYSGKCSWYCGGEVLRVTASSHLKGTRRFNYKPANAHDFNHESVWAEGVKGQGIGESLTYEFAGACPRITTVKILNGHVKNAQAWRNNSRVKKLLMYYNGKPYAMLQLDDSRSLQTFDVGILGPHDSAAPNWKLKFEIKEVYPGDKYDDTVISELFFDGIDVH